MPPSPRPSQSAWDHVSRDLLAKLLAELSYEGVLTPEPEGEPHDGATPYRLPVTDQVTYRFRARRGAYGHWRVDPRSISPHGDALRFLADAHDTVLDLTGDTTGHLVRELTATLAADVRLHTTALSAPALADLGYADLEGHQTGHPWLVANKGRFGFSAADADRWAPEARVPQR
ncbi:IucA/IucC family protein, partial [Streptomyces varsoviensis]